MLNWEWLVNEVESRVGGVRMICRVVVESTGQHHSEFTSEYLAPEHHQM